MSIKKVHVGWIEPCSRGGFIARDVPCHIVMFRDVKDEKLIGRTDLMPTGKSLPPSGARPTKPSKAKRHLQF